MYSAIDLPQEFARGFLVELVSRCPDQGGMFNRSNRDEDKASVAQSVAR